MKDSKSRHEKRWGEREDLTGEHGIGDAGQLFFAIIFFGVWIADSFFLNYTTQLNHFVSGWVRNTLGIAILIISGYCALTGMMIVFGEVRENPSVIRKGVFSVVRHPIYLSEVLLYLGMFILSMSLASLAVMLVADIFLYFLCRHEEKLLLKRFGRDYENYMQEVGMWFPRLKKNKI
ncbi:MAG: isoprenylcysteine carboxylmethyltransferase family protein [bacterium]